MRYESRRWAFGVVMAVVMATAGSGEASAWGVDREARILELAPPFGDGMVLQRATTVPIRGTGAPGAVVRVRADWPGATDATGRVDADGDWSVAITTGAAGGPFTVTIDLAGDVRTLGDVLLGEVWVAGGQSNMEMRVAPGRGLGGVLDWPGEVARANAPRVRVFDVPNAWAAEPRSSVAADAAWTPVTSDSVAGMSAVAWFFAEQLHAELDVPVGIITSAVGGTRIEAWMSEPVVREHGGLDDVLAAVVNERADPGALARRRTAAVAAARRRVEEADPGIRDRWMGPNLDVDDWGEATVGAHWSRPPLSDHDGYVWMRRLVFVPAADPAETWSLELGGIDDRDMTWVNGTLVGRTDGDGRWNEPRRYDVAAGIVRSGWNAIAVRVHDTGGPGGMVGPADAMRLRPSGGGAAIPLDGAWQYRLSLREDEIPSAAAVPRGRADRNMPTVLHNAMIAPIAPYGIRGFIFYQGEGNRGDALYPTLLPALVADWRSGFAAPDAPFLNVQIAPFGYAGGRDQAAWVREAQRRAESIPGYGLVVTTDVGSRHDIHPLDKRTVGTRLADLALSDSYGIDRGEVRSAVPAEIRFEDGAAVVRFTRTGGGLEIRGGRRATHWQVRGDDGRWTSGRVTVDGDVVTVASGRVPVPVAVRFGWGPAPEPNLFGASGLPVTPFSSEAFPAGD